ncbi:MAG: CofH family radical SAM protein [Flavobacteriales bacterium]|jgi:aminodeoxyfutalosine synthase|nr:CofH family radical SAM protein [Flavobacteriales bacterium]
MLDVNINISKIDKSIQEIVNKIIQETRINNNEALKIFTQAPNSLLFLLANARREKLNGNNTFFNKNIHIEPTNICVFDCKFCSYSRLLKEKSQSWEYSLDEMVNMVEKYNIDEITEVHIVGGVHPKMGLKYFIELIKRIKDIRPNIHIKAFTAVELEYMCRKAKVTYKKGLKMLKEAGQNSLPGGGAEIFAKEIRDIICKDKCTSKQWLEIHRTAHEIGMQSNATILYGHIEKPRHIIDHMSRIRDLQDITNGFNAFIPLKYRNGNNQMSHLKEVSIIDDIRMYSIARIFFDNIKHIKAYWPMIGKETTQSLLSFGVDDIDGTIDDSTKIYSMAGVEDQNPTMSTSEITSLIKKVKRIPIERDSIYNQLKVH